VVSAKVMVVEDESDVRMLIRLLLEDEGYAVVEARNGDEALDRFTLERPDLVLLDIRLPGRNGFEVCRLLRERTDVPIVMVTAQDDTHDVVTGLESGADDYVTKPFVEKELLARVRAQLRRTQRANKVEVLRAGDLEIRVDEGVVYKRDEPVSLTKTEFHLLVFLAGNPLRVYSREMLLDQVWGYSFAGDGRLVDAHVRRLRLKIEDDPAEPTIVQTVRGLGYRLVP
jgi:DNA-binding response OmpR family regulator